MVVCWQKAITLWFQNKVDILEKRELHLRSPNFLIQAPAVLKLRKYIKPKLLRKVRLTRDNIFLRDDYRCQYCERVFSSKNLTLDHVMPASRGGGKSWENLVASCKKCNHKKNNNTPEEAGMKLYKNPVELKWTPNIENKSILSSQDQLWSPYLKYTFT